MPRLLGIGDNTVDLYLSDGTMYPGGNAVNVAVLSARLGHSASYVGCVGTDAAGELILSALRAEGVDLSHCRQMEGMTSWSGIEHRDGDRYFVGSAPGVQGEWTLTEADLTFTAAHDLVHTSIYSRLDDALPRIRQAAALLSYDFSSEWTTDLLARVAPQLDVAFLSAGEDPLPEATALAEEVAGYGAGVVVVTRGARGALALTDTVLYTQNPVPAAVVDTLGAGDAFITAFLHCWATHHDVPAALTAGAHEAARNCAVHGAFGYGTPIPAHHLARP
ncbi:PfkB family carbohydrate kinase [Deinococcus deserti]|uniref:Putative fructoselysine kinase n=1 Tax=Deinococcus deserti (strain DSM 17065 / CIP 109153 / LMG 22923 / VCD115) TaxID=546414 RepID=C1D442_DEIDV|nr:PfkB family carbohydrate kinase [Deinococcus deserti]ACO47923.1 putative fructoselysine kinase [Deinococcus deserti VCD115]